MSTDLLGEFERLVLLAVLRCDSHAYALPVRREIEEAAERSVSRGALYRTLERLATKGLVDYRFEDADETRGGHPRKIFRVTPPGVEALRRSHAVTARLTDGLERVLEGSS